MNRKQWEEEYKRGKAFYENECVRRWKASDRAVVVLRLAGDARGYDPTIRTDGKIPAPLWQTLLVGERGFEHWLHNPADHYNSLELAKLAQLKQTVEDWLGGETEELPNSDLSEDELNQRIQESMPGSKLAERMAEQR